MHQRLKGLRSTASLHQLAGSIPGYSRLAEMLEIPEEDFDRLYAIWDKDFAVNLERIAAAPFDLRVHLLSSSLSEYRRARNQWWENIENNTAHIRERPVYFISSNTHSVVNILSGFALQHEDQLVRFLQQPGNSGLLNEWKDIQAGHAPSSAENFLYYVLEESPAIRGRPGAGTRAEIERKGAGHFSHPKPALL